MKGPEILIHIPTSKTLARRCSQHPWLTIGTWFLFIIVALALVGTMMADGLTTDIEPTNNPESEQAKELIAERIDNDQQQTTEAVLVNSPDKTVEDIAFQDYIASVSDNISALGSDVILNSIYYYQNTTANSYLVSSDRHTTTLLFTLASRESLNDFCDVLDNMGHNQWQTPSDPLNPDAGIDSFSIHSISLDAGEEIITVKSSDYTIADAEYKAFIEELFYDIAAQGRNVVSSGLHYYLVGDASLVSENKDATIIPLKISDKDEIHPVHEVIEEARRNSSFDIYITGQATVNSDFNELCEHDAKSGELMIGLPMAAIVLVLVFGAVIAAAIPLILAMVSIAIALGLAMLFSEFLNLSIFVMNMTMMMGLALGIDYCIFIIARYREERAKGWGKYDAIERTGATANQAVLFSGITVVLALIALTMVPHNVILSLGLGAVLVATVSIIASLTLLPAILGLLGDCINALHVPIIYKKQSNTNTENSGGMWDRISRAVMRVPVASILLFGGLLIAISIPLFNINIGVAGVSSFPDRAESKKGFIALEQDFAAGLSEPTLIVIDGEIASTEVQQGIGNLEAYLAEDTAFGDLSDEQVNPAGDLAVVEVPVAKGDAMSDAAISAVKRLRNDYIPKAFDITSAKVLVGGQTAENIDLVIIGNNGLRVIIPFVLCLSFILLTLVFRSLVIPVKAVIMNLLSVGAAYGLVVLVFQEGVGADFLGFQQVDTIEWPLPSFLFAVLFGLSMDYHVFLLSRIKERFHKTGDNTDSVAYGIRSTGRLITGAAAIMIAVFIGFAAGDMVMFQQIGFGLAVAVFLDATIVRSILVPASMKLLGSKNWYLPSWLQWLPQIRTEEELAETLAPTRQNSPYPPILQ